MSTQLPAVTEHDFDDLVLRSPIPVLLDFGAAWCPPCRAIEPLLETLAVRNAGRARVLRIDADESPEIAARYRVRALPTVISFVDGKEHKRHTGGTNLSTLAALLP
jgi:thioredoxin 1